MKNNCVASVAAAKELEAFSFTRRLNKFKRELAPGMSLKVYPFTEDQSIDKKVRFAKIIHKYDNWALLQDEKGFKYGPTYHKLMEWGN